MQSREFNLCRVCLITDKKTYSLERDGTASTYSMLLGIDPASEAGLPSTVCYECSAQLRRLGKFAAKTQRAYNLLMEVIWRNGEISEKDIKKIDRIENNLASSLTSHRLVELSIDSELSGKCEVDTAVLDIKRDIVDGTAESTTLKYEAADVLTEVKIKKEHDEIKFFEEFIDDYIPEDEPIKESKKNKSVQRDKNGEDSKNVKNEPKRTRRKNIKQSLEQTNTKEEERCVDDDVSVRLKSIPNKRKRRTDATQTYRSYKEDYETFATVTVMSEEEGLEMLRERGEKSKYTAAAYKCRDCYLGFLNQLAYNRHRRKHDPSAGAFPCGVCKVRLQNKHQLKKHVAMNHRTRFACKKCPHVCTNGQRARHHESTHTENSYQCEECNQTFTRQVTYKQHMRARHPAESACAACGVAFLSRAALRTHAAVCRPHHEVGAAPCVECGINFQSPEALRLHLHHSGKHNVGGVTLWGCELCEERFSDAASARAHRAAAHKPAPVDATAVDISCEQCGERMTDSRAYHAHFRRAHPDKTRTQYFGMRAPHMCEHCGKVFQSAAQLQVHAYRHTGERPYRCHVCDKGFALEAMRKIHVRTHTKEQPYKCRVCAQPFNNYANMMRHQTVHTDAKPFSCDICAKSFKYRSTATAHLQYVHLKKPWPKRDRSKRKQTARVDGSLHEANT